MYRDYLKTTADLIGACIGIVVLSPLFLIISMVLFFVYSGNPFFTQERPGKNGKTFRIIKFRSMTNKRNAQGVLLPKAERLTRTGLFLRKTSLDELPQLINIIKGEMSFVGPRPLLTEYLPLYNKEQSRRHEVRPGITGWAQVNGRNTISWQQKFAYDVWYVDHLSFTLDVKILWFSLSKVFLAKEVNALEQVGMEKFTGNKSTNGSTED